VRTAYPLLDAAAARAGDAAAVDAGDTWSALMERAGGHLARGVVAAAGRSYGLRVAILVGKGNNGGDGWVAARRLTALGAQAWVVAVDGVDVEVSRETAANRARWRAGGGRTSSGVDDLPRTLAWCDVAVDALLGTGVSGPRAARRDRRPRRCCGPTPTGRPSWPATSPPGSPPTTAAPPKARSVPI
jgi:ADP-dependent NAD(P)H-hydrate dehydratase / NAD(P)H-hydrate epimerase